MRRSRQEILDLFQAFQSKLGKAPGQASFCGSTGVKPSEVNYYWSPFSELVKEAGARPNEFTARLSDDEVFSDYAKVCLKMGRVASQG